MSTRSKTALVTGGAVRVGKAISHGLSERGYRVVVHYGSSEEEAHETAVAIRSAGGEADLLQADLANADAARALVQQAVAITGGLDVLVNNAAIFLTGGMADTDLEMWNKQFDINLRAPFLLCREFARHVPEDALGVIVNVLDTRIFRPGPDHFAYRLTKEALAAMTRNLALDLAPRIRVNGVAPGAVLPPPGKDAAFLDAVVEKRVPLRIPGSAEQVAATTLHLVESEFLTGVIVPVDGGEAL